MRNSNVIQGYFPAGKRGVGSVAPIRTIGTRPMPVQAKLTDMNQGTSPAPITMTSRPAAAVQQQATAPPLVRVIGARPCMVQAQAAGARPGQGSLPQPIGMQTSIVVQSKGAIPMTGRVMGPKTPAPPNPMTVVQSRASLPLVPPRPNASRSATVQRVGNGEAFSLPASLSNFGGGTGQPLPDTIRQRMESFFKTSFADVRVHVGPQASSIGALAFTHGSNLYFAPGQYNPGTSRGQQLLGHELTHVVQQRAGQVQNPFGSGIAVVQDRRLEAEADRLGRLAAARAPGARSSHQPLRPALKHAASPLQASVQCKIEVSVSGTMPKIKDMVITSVRVFNRRMPVKSTILGTKKKGHHIRHMGAWDLRKRRWERKYVGSTIEEMADALNCNYTIDSVNQAYAKVIANEAKLMRAYYGPGLQNIRSGQAYKLARKNYELSHRLRHTAKKKWTKKQLNDHLSKKRILIETSLDVPTATFLNIKSNKRQKLLTEVTEEIVNDLTEAYSTDEDY